MRKIRSGFWAGREPLREKDTNMDKILAFQLCAIPVISAVTGYVTNYIAVRMLFRPRRERRILGFSLHGLIPHRRAQIAESIGQTVEQHLISHDDIRNALQNPDVSHGIEAVVDQRVTLLLKEKLATVHPMVGFLMNDQLIEKLKGVLMREILSAIPEITDELLKKLEENLDFRQLVVQKIEDFDLEMFEQIVLRISARELWAIEVLGGVLGFGIGLLTDAAMVLPKLLIHQ